MVHCLITKHYKQPGAPPIPTLLTENEIGPIGVRALPLAAGRNEGGHYFHNKIISCQSFLLFFSFLFLPPLFKTTEGVIVLIQIFAWAPK